MKAIVKVSAEAGAVEVRELPMPEPGPGEVLVKMGASGICYSDVRGIRWVEYKKVTAEPIVSRPFRLDEVNEAFEAFKAGEAAKVLFVM